MEMKKTVRNAGLIGLLALNGIQGNYASAKIESPICNLFDKGYGDWCAAIINDKLIWLSDYDRNGKVDEATIENYPQDIIIKDQKELAKWQTLYDLLRKKDGKPITKK